MKTIALTQSKVALVDDQDYAWLNQWKWCANKYKNKTRIIWYALRAAPRKNGKQRTILMHRVIAARTRITDVDHRDCDGLNNQRSNLRPATRRQNLHHQCKQPGRSSRFKGVYWYKQTNRWKAQITINGKRKHLGYFVNEEDAARAYDRAAVEAFGEFALLNFP